MRDTKEFSDQLRQEARRLGFDKVGIAPAVRAPGFDRFEAWLERGYDAGMAYLRRHGHAREHPDSILDGVRSVVVVSLVYGLRREPCGDPRRGQVARYACVADYHEVIWRRLERLLEWAVGIDPGMRGRAVADTAPLLEREFGRLAGLGWIGKNTMLIDRRLGSYTVLGALLLDRELDYDPPHEASHCGTCTRCLDACPTGAFPEPHTLDAHRCLSYWTIEHRGTIPDSMADRLEGWAFGCDICQEVCPWNRKAPEAGDHELSDSNEWSAPDLIGWLEADPQEFRRRIKGTALSRAKRSGLLRNAALILGTRRSLEAVPALIKLLGDGDELIRDSAAWALGRIANPEALQALDAARREGAAGR